MFTAGWFTQKVLSNYNRIYLPADSNWSESGFIVRAMVTLVMYRIFGQFGACQARPSCLAL